MDNCISIYELSQIIKENFNNINGNFTISGEVQNLNNKHHMYFNLKDIKQNYSIRCIMWKKNVKKCEIKNGDVIIIQGKLNVYDVNNSYSFVVNQLQKKEEIKTDYEIKFEKYKNLGYFSNKTKIIKKNIKNVGIITSLRGQAIHDFKKTIEKRFFAGNIYLYDVNVQGIHCANDIINAIDYFENDMKNIDTILITRGGGSSIDLNEFNNDKLIEKIHNRKKIIICAIGHEKDNCICDYVCDLKSSTPTSLALEISNDKNVIESRLIKILNNDKMILKQKISNYMLEIIKIKNFLYQNMLNNRPNGVYFNNTYITKIDDFEKIKEQNFNIKLEDGIINFTINNFKIIQKNNSIKFNEYMKIYNMDYSTVINDENLIENFEKFKEEKVNFGSNKHYSLFKNIIQVIGLNVHKLKNIHLNENINKCIKFNKSKNVTYDYLLNYKQYLNYIDYLINNDFKKINIKIKNKDIDYNKLYDKYLHYNCDKGITIEILALYLQLQKIKISFNNINKIDLFKK